MANPRIYYYPSASAGLRVIDFGEGATAFEEDFVPEREDARGGDLTPWPAYGGTRYRYTFVLERFGAAGGTDLERRLQAFLAHARAGRVFAVALDPDQAWAALATTLRGGATAIATTGNGFTAWEDATALDDGTEVVVESAAPEWNYEVHTVASQAGRTLTLAQPVAFDYDGYVLVRHRDFLPVCFVPPEELGGRTLMTFQRIGYTLRLTFEHLPSSTIRLWAPRALQTPYQVGSRWSLPSLPAAGALPLRDTSTVVRADAHTLDSLLSAWSGGTPRLGDPRRWR